ncbi:MAG: efflux RND transporter periplasmic adaptor subunit [Gammaproteobacteria bacterium]|jgi:RND family efflux transporter MFP subunit|nr:efflux RND transporter periplasmic adaptor subunit [Gammaproteobacteria bacterium]
MKSRIYYLVLSLSVFASNVLVAEEAIPVKTAALSELAIYPQRTAPATVVSLNTTRVAAEIPAKIEVLNARVGDIVEKDQILVELKCIDYEIEQDGAEARLKSLEARIELAKRRLERTRKLTMKQSVSEELLDERESDLTVLQADRLAAKATLNLAKVRVATCTIKSPFRALVTERTSSIGNYAEVGKTLVKILDLEQLEISAQIYAQDVYQLETSNQLMFLHDDKSYPVNLRAILPSINSETRNSEVRLLFQNGPALPGASGKLIWNELRAHIPGNLIVKRKGELGVFIYAAGKAQFVALPTAQAGRASPVDLSLNSIIITEGHFALNNNDAVVVH